VVLVFGFGCGSRLGFRSVLGAFFGLVFIFELLSVKGLFSVLIGSKFLVLVGRLSGFFCLAQQIFFSYSLTKYWLHRSKFFGGFFHSCEARKGAFYTALRCAAFIPPQAEQGAFFWRIFRHLLFLGRFSFRAFRSVCLAWSARLARLLILGLFALNRFKFGSLFVSDFSTIRLICQARFSQL